MKPCLRYIVLSGILLATLIVGIVSPSITIERSRQETVITLAFIDTAYAETADYICDGVDDHVQYQAALNALPASGGKLYFYTGNYVFGATVTRAIANVSFEGLGLASYIAFNATNPIITAGGNNWQFEDLRTDAGGLNMGATTGWQWHNIVINATTYTLRTPNTTILGTGDLTSVSGNFTTSLTIAGATAENTTGSQSRVDTHASDTSTHGVAQVAGVADITGTKIDDLTQGDDNTDLNTNSSRHGLFPKLPNTGTQFWRDDGSWQTVSGTGNVTYIAGFVAANDATTAEKAQAQWLCDGTNDEVQIATAEAAGPYTLSSGTFNIQAALALDTGNPGVGQGSGDVAGTTTLAVAGTNYGITISPSGSSFGSLRHVNITTPQNFNTVALKVDGGNTDIRSRDILEDITVKAYHAGVGEGTPDITAGSRGIQITTSGGFVFNRFSHLYTTGYEYGIHLYINRTAGYVYLNANQFYDVTAHFPKYGIVLEAITNSTFDTGVIQTNTFFGVAVQPYNDAGKPTQYAFWLKGTVGSGVTYNVSVNMFYGVAIWDWPDFGGSSNIVLNDRTGYNMIEGMFNDAAGGGGVADTGTGNILTGWATI